jgi:hypothetical protein
VTLQKPSFVALVLTAVNAVILVVALVLVVRPATAPEVADVLRGRSLEIVDTNGRVRAQLIIEPAGEQDGLPYAETVLFRLMNPDGLPGVKLASSAASMGLLVSRDASNPQGWSGVQILAEEQGGSVRVVGANGAEQLIEP